MTFEDFQNHQFFTLCGELFSAIRAEQNSGYFEVNQRVWVRPIYRIGATATLATIDESFLLPNCLWKHCLLAKG